MSNPFSQPAFERRPWLIDLGLYATGTWLSLGLGALLTGILGDPWFSLRAPFLANHPQQTGACYATLLLLALLTTLRWEGRKQRRRSARSGAAAWKALRRGFLLMSGALAAVSALLGTVLGFLGMPFYLAFLITAMPLVPFSVVVALGRLRAEWEALRERDQALQSQLAPHFILNALTTLKAQIAEDPTEAQATVDLLARLVREVVELAQQAQVPLSREVAFTEAYLGLEQARLGERLRVDLDLPEDLEEWPVPPLSLQILAENAVKHGIASRPQGGTVNVRAEQTAEGLRLSVEDPGTGLSSQRGSGQGLDLLRRRLVHTGDLQLEVLPTGGHRASLLLRP